MTWYMGRVSGHTDRTKYARPRVIRGTRTAPLPLLPSGPGGVCSRPLHEARDLTSIYRNMGSRRGLRAGYLWGYGEDDIDGKRYLHVRGRDEGQATENCR